MSKSDWIHRGPYNVGGRTRAISFDVLNENIILMVLQVVCFGSN